MTIRLDKYLCSCGIGTRSEVKKLIRQKRVSVNNVITDKSDFKVDENDIVALDGVIKEYNKFTYIMLNKPEGCLSATRDNTKKTVIDLLDEKYRNIGLFPVGRLDRDTKGLLILTNDGDFAHRTLSPKKHVLKTYYALVEGELKEEAVEIFNKGVTLKDFTYESAKLIIEGKQRELTAARVTIHEGKYHQVKRMFHAVGCKVVYLKRLSFGEIELDNSLKEGEYRLLNDKELDYIRSVKK